MGISAAADILIPDINDPTKWYSFSETNVSAPWTPFFALPYGWIIFFLRVPSGPATPVVTPSLLPTDVVAASGADSALSASVVLPEASGFNQYWVTVLEQYRWAQLDTAQWKVIFLKNPNP
jgi:hypothetical protein